MMTTKVFGENGRLLEVQNKGNTVWSREKELEDVAAAAARGAVEGASGVSGDKQKSVEAARQAVRENL